jgi:3-phenylpropionate/trans-cinnamate dioxygenase ferredoxin reductase subunit
VISNGIRVDEFAQTSHSDIVAAGDCTNHPSLLYLRDIRLESVQNANDQARVAAANLCGKKLAYDAVPWFWSDQFSTKLQSTGLLEGFDECVVRGEPSVSNDSGFAIFYLKAGKVIAADCVARPKEFMAVKQLLKADIAVDIASLSDESIEPASWLK